MNDKTRTVSRAGIAALAVALLLSAQAALAQTGDPSTLDAARLAFGKSVIEKYGDKMSEASRRSILEQKIAPGIPPYEAQLAGGECFYEVVADPAKWPAGTDPFTVIGAQSLHPDHSRITLYFRNSTQFPEKGMTRFKVTFVEGRAAAIEVLADK
jgi:hypothetical protein